MKKCNTCNKLKSLDDFYNCKSSKDGKVYSCKICVINRAKKHYKDNRKSKLEYANKYREDNRDEINKKLKIYR